MGVVEPLLFCCLRIVGSKKCRHIFLTSKRHGTSDVLHHIFSYAVTVGSLPSGLGLSNNTISGTHSKAKTYAFVITVTDALGSTQNFKLLSTQIKIPMQTKLKR
jgi:hypothetical protein